MAEMLTPQQQAAVSDRGGRLLVSAAAGSGKTKVLVDRLMSYLLDPVSPANLDDFLIITYTKAAAAELRGKIAAKLVEKIAEQPDNRHLQRQMQRLYLTKISTVHAFCADLLREHAYLLDIAGDFRVAEESECQQLQDSAMNSVLEKAYETISQNLEFRTFVDTQGLGRDDRTIPQIVMQVYSSARCHLNPDAWLQKCLDMQDVSAVTDVSETVWGAYLIKDLHDALDGWITALSNCIHLAEKADAMEKPTALLEQTRQQLQTLRNSASWDEIVQNSDIDFGRLVFSKKITDFELADQIKAVRSACKKNIEKRLSRFSDSSEQIIHDLADSLASLRGLIALVRQFTSAYDSIKKSRRVLDFSDLEHKTLDLLLGKNRTGATAAVQQIEARFREVMVDEYQDTNAVQDAIFSVLTQKRQNCFMVGDVKQSIYQFRLADPGIFLQKYNNYLPAEYAQAGQGRKVLLSSNFRSSGGIISAVNDVFSKCMTPKVGGLSYGQDEALREGIAHQHLDCPDVSLHCIRVQEDTYAEEANFVAMQIKTLLDGKHMVRQGDTLRQITPGDIVILLRSPGSVGSDFCNALERSGIRCKTGNTTDLLQTEEVSTLCSLLQVLQNPLQDIALIAVLSSRVFGFTADDLANIRGQSKQMLFYNALRNSSLKKSSDFLHMYTLLRNEVKLKGISQLIELVFQITKLDSMFAALPDGEQRLENLRAFCQIASNFEAMGEYSLQSFMEYLDSMRERGIAPANETADADSVTIMSIHKSKGLEFPVVFLCGLSRAFNSENARAQVLCDKELGLGLACVDIKNRVRYPSVAKRAIAAKILADGISEEMRVLYVAMTRAKDRLIMTYASRYLDTELSELAMEMDMCPPELLNVGVDCPGKWVLYAAMRRIEAGNLFKLAGRTPATELSEDTWTICVEVADEEVLPVVGDEQVQTNLPYETIQKIKAGLCENYRYQNATTAPSKLTATQLKGRIKDMEAAENTVQIPHSYVPESFSKIRNRGVDYGNAIHAVMQYIDFCACTDAVGIKNEIERLVAEQYISREQADMVDVNKIFDFTTSEIGKRLSNCKQLLREFKFSLLVDAKDYIPDLDNEAVLLQGVVDCAIIDDEAITIIDFKTDNVTSETMMSSAEGYKMQVSTYAKAMERIFQLPVKEKLLYYFRLGKFVACE